MRSSTVPARVAQSIHEAVEHLAAGLSHGGLSRGYATGLVQCLRHPSLGQMFLESALEPTIRAVEARPQAHVDMGEMVGDPRSAALMLISPLLVAHMHQSELGADEHALSTSRLSLNWWPQALYERMRRIDLFRRLLVGQEQALANAVVF